MNIVIVDYGMGNIQSIIGALHFIGVQNVVLSRAYPDLEKADKFILPGVGSFAKAMQTIRETELKYYLDELVIQRKKPILGICLGMQLLGLSSTEHGDNDGLGYVPGVVTRFSELSEKIPHVGFNQVIVNNDLKLYRNMDRECDFYFTHSYCMQSEAPIHQSYCTYGEKFIASYEKDHIAGVQFHPELSQRDGLKLLKNFIEHF